MNKPIELPRVRLLRKHSRKCFFGGRENPWASFGSRDRIPDRPNFERFQHVFYADAKGRGKHGWYRWLTVGCNDRDCPAVLAVRECDLLALAQRALEEKSNG